MGNYSLAGNNEAQHFYRLGHPLAQTIIKSCINSELPAVELNFSYSDEHLINISILNSLVGKSGYIQLFKFSICTFECEDYLQFAGFTDDGLFLDNEQCSRMFNLPAKIGEKINVNEEIITKLNDIFNRKKSEIIDKKIQLDENISRDETIKLENWADDLIRNAETDIKNTKTKIREFTKQIRDATNQQEILDLNKQISEFENKKRKQRQQIFELEDLTDQRRKEMIEKISLRMQQKTITKSLFIIKWNIV